MFRKMVAWVGAVLGLGPTVLGWLKRAADTSAIIHLPGDIGEAIEAMSHAPMIVSWGAFLIGLACLCYLIVSHAPWKAAPTVLTKVLTPPERSTARIRLREFLPVGNIPAQRDVGVSEAIAYICFREWGKRFFEAAASSEVDGNAEYNEFMQAAADGVVTVWGQRATGAVYEPIPLEYWRAHRIEWFELLRDRPLTESTEGKISEQNYFNLMTSRAEVERQWSATGKGHNRK